MKSSKSGRAAAGLRAQGGAARARVKPGRVKGIPSTGSAETGDLLELYRPLKKPITVRIDADVLAWFKKDGRRYQTRINSALREFMDRETKRR